MDREENWLGWAGETWTSRKKNELYAAVVAFEG
jgi:hypothetical protein